VLKIQATERNRMHGEAKGRFTLLGYYFHIATTSWYQTSLPRIPSSVSKSWVIYDIPLSRSEFKAFLYL